MFITLRTTWTCIACQHRLERGAPPECQIWLVVHNGGLMIVAILAIVSAIVGPHIPLAWLAYAWLGIGGIAAAYVLGDVLRTRRSGRLWQASLDSEVCPACGAVGRWHVEAHRGIT